MSEKTLPAVAPTAPRRRRGKPTAEEEAQSAQAMEDAMDAELVARSAAAAGQPKVTRADLADVRRWWNTLEEARKFDDTARRQYAIDRRNARGDSGFLVDANIIGTNIDILTAFYYARDPDFQITPGKAMRPPTAEAIRDAVEATMQADGSLAAAGAMAMQAAIAAGANEVTATALAEKAQLAAVEAEIKAKVFEIRQRYAKRNREIKAFCQTCEIIGTRMWEDARLKRRGVPQVRSALTVGVGWIKASWQERTEVSPTTSQAINDLTENLKLLRALQAEQADATGHLPIGTSPAPQNQDIEQDPTKGAAGSGSYNDTEARIAEIQQQIKALQQNAERVAERGFVVDNIQAENMQIPPGYALVDHLDAPWNADYDYPTFEQALADHGEYLKSLGYNPVETLNKATKYAPRKPVMILQESVGAVSDRAILTEEADGFVSQGGAGYAESSGKSCHVRRVEIWDRNANCVRTMIEGVPVWVVAPWNPPPTTRFYPYFLFETGAMDGQRHPQSLPTRSEKLIAEYNRIGSDETKHRRRIIPKTAFDAGNIPEPEAKKLEKADIGEMVAIKTTQPGSDLRMALVPVQYPEMDPRVYDRARIMNEIERIWGIQEALGGAVDTEKTATEAEIQQSGFNARTSSRRDNLDGTYSDLARYTIEIARKYVTLEDAIEICGDDAFWPAYGGPDDVVYSIAISVRAGSSGKPNTSRERESWAALLPTLQSGIIQIGQLRGASPDEIADSLEEVIKLTAERSGEVIDVESLIPRGGGMQPGGMMGAPAAPGAPAPAGGPAGAPIADDTGSLPPDPQEQAGSLPGGADPLAPENAPKTFA